MRRTVAAGFLFFFIAAFMWGCVKKNQPASVVVVGRDTLTYERIRALVPEVTNDSDAIRQIGARLTYAHELPASEKPVDSIVKKCAVKLSMISNKEYSPDAAGILLTAAIALHKTVRTTPEAKKDGTAKFLEKSIQTHFAVSDEEAATLVSFIKNSDDEESGNVKVMVQGLIADTAVRASAPLLKKKNADHSKKILAFRSQASIRDSIAKHLADLQQLYKRHLKRGDYADGTVWVSFRVNYEGMVIDARVKKSHIADAQFLERLEKYLKIIRFKPVPESCGIMNFEFPFEFKAEEL
jgi:TonB family protein